MKSLVIGICLLLLSVNAAYAVSIHEAKDGGLVGERNDGYVGYVVVPPSNEVKALVKEVNNKRRAKFPESAKSNGLQADQVANRFYQRAVKATERGHYYQNASGKWVQK